MAWHINIWELKMKRLLFQSSLLFFVSSLISATASTSSGLLSQESLDLVKIFEVVIAGIVASTVVLSIFALFVGQWSGKKQNIVIKKIRDDIEKDKKSVESLVADVEESVAEVNTLIKGINNKTSVITSKQHQAWVQVEDIEQMVEDALECSSELKQTTEGINQRMTQIQNYWDEQLKESKDTVERVHSTLEQGLEKVESGLEALQNNEIKSRALSQQVVESYNQQSDILSNNATASKEIRLNLDKAFAESKQLIEQLNTQKQSAEKSFQQYNEHLGAYESQAYEQFDSVFQATDIARKELDANVNESRLYINNLRRYEEEGRNIKLQARHHLDMMNDKSMDLFATTLENTQKMFSALQNDVQDAQYAIDSLRKMKQQMLEPQMENIERDNNTGRNDDTQIKESTKEVEKRAESATDYLAISGDSTLIPFFSGKNKK